MATSIEDNFGDEYYQHLPQFGASLGELLCFFGVKRTYGVGGDFVANLINALEPHVEVLPSSNEMHAGFSACAQAELNPLGVCMTTYTVGSLPCVSAAALARTEGLPVVFISGAPGENEVNSHALHHSVHPSTAWNTDLDAALNAFRALGIRAERLQGQRHSGQPNIAAEQCLDLLTYAYLNRQPVFIEIPRDLINQPTQSLRLPSQLAQLTGDQQLSLSGAELIARNIEKKLTAASSPLVFLGEKLRLNQALLTKIIAFCRQQGLPYATSWFGKGMLDESDSLCLGSYNGAFSEIEGKAYIESVADYVLELGTAISPSDTNNAFSSQTHAVDSHKNKTMLKGTSRWEQDISVVMDLLQSAHLTPRKLPAQFGDGVIASNIDSLMLGYHNLAATINLAQGELSKPYIFVPEVGSALFASFELQTLNGDLGRSYLANPWYAAMGTCLPYARAIADQLIEMGSKQPILVLTGDGGFNFQANELINLQKQAANVTIIYMRNNIFHLGKAGDAPVYACNHLAFDPKLLIQAYGGQGHLCETTGQLIDCLVQSAAVGGLHLIEVPTSTEPEYQSEITKKLNTYIGFRNGNEEATSAWKTLCGE
ncbi:thiamine pyrophosphate-binding protein [Shewanella eurypsychrophilus]|uniref:Thiamine pyrophosphate-binding protein n=1 Tax=Shewanella eurypsychrophilus TaxID=2593656 RepID=A0ABX6V0W2_9GAMM|nr:MULTISPECIES: thiamine pyrophosphate-binding protein [Shewanella]QFU20578.1 thiamine pyrophosphate-binding protein [Shewanella sp. YLB-09]QFU20859.1 thiamine pyrophosphate-binding protein [Shewanella sp. YLB-09]QPG56148.1 thiamine pyrophosphate-binding protein [Shewanella eurypsychrophilus]